MLIRRDHWDPSGPCRGLLGSIGACQGPSSSVWGYGRSVGFHQGSGGHLLGAHQGSIEGPLGSVREPSQILHFLAFDHVGLVDNDNTFENDFAYSKKYLDLLDVTIDQHLSHQYSKTDNKKKYLAVAGTVGWPGRLLTQNTIFLMHQPITHSSGYSAVHTPYS